MVPVHVLFKDERQVSEYFYIQIYNDENQAVSKYKITLTGIFSSPRNRRIIDVSVSYEFGDICQTSYNIDGYNVTVTVTHPTEGQFEKFFVLGANGRFF